MGRDAPVLYSVIKAVASPLVRMAWRPEVTGVEHVPETGGAILAPNHNSFLDSVFLPAVVPRPIFFLGKSDYFNGAQRYFFESVGVMPVYREGGDAGEASLKMGQKVLEDGALLGIYPEGTRSPDGRLYRGKTGPVRLAARTGCPILPVAITGTRTILPTGAKIPKIAPLGIHIGPPIDLDRALGGDVDDRLALRSATDELMYEIMARSGQEYVDVYAAKVKDGDVASPEGQTLDELGQVRGGDIDLSTS